MMRDYKISRGILTYYTDAPYSKRSTHARRLQPVGGDIGPKWLLAIKGMLWKLFGI